MAVFKIKESRFSYIRSIDGTGVKGLIHRGSKVIVEVYDMYMIVFTSETFHTLVKSYERQSGA